MDRVGSLGPHAALVAAVMTCLVLLTSSACAVEFTTNTTITSSQYSGEDIIVTGCTLHDRLCRRRRLLCEPPGALERRCDTPVRQ